MGLNGIWPQISLSLMVIALVSPGAKTSSVLLRNKNNDQFDLPSTLNRFGQNQFLKAESEGNGGYFLDEVEGVTRADTLECPSTNVISTRYKCQVKDKWVDCFRKHCCQGYNFVAGKCLPETVDPCLYNLCEQKCSVYFGRVICTCFSGFVFSPDNQKKGVKPVCLDKNECEKENGGCDHFCLNTNGSFQCKCRPGHQLQEDNRTCELVSEGGLSSLQRESFIFPTNKDFNDVRRRLEGSSRRGFHKEGKDKCYTSCSLFSEMEKKIKDLEERLVALSTAVRLYSFAAGPPGPQGPFGPPGAPGKRGFPGPEGPQGSLGPPGPPSVVVQTNNPLVEFEYPGGDVMSPEDVPFDSWTVINEDSGRRFCRCRRGPLGHPGAPGREGPRGLRGEQGHKGEKGDPGSFDFLLLMMADVKHDILKLQEKVFADGNMPDQFDLSAAIDQGYPNSVDKSTYRTHLRELLTEEIDNRIYGAARTHGQLMSHHEPQTDSTDTMKPSVNGNCSGPEEVSCYKYGNVGSSVEFQPPVEEVPRKLEDVTEDKLGDESKGQLEDKSGNGMEDKIEDKMEGKLEDKWKYKPKDKFKDKLEENSEDNSEDKLEDKQEDKSDAIIKADFEKVIEKKVIESKPPIREVSHNLEDILEDKPGDESKDQSEDKSGNKMKDKSEDKTEDELKNQSEHKSKYKSKDNSVDNSEDKPEDKSDAIIKDDFAKAIESINENIKEDFDVNTDANLGETSINYSKQNQTDDKIRNEEMQKSSELQNINDATIDFPNDYEYDYESLIGLKFKFENNHGFSGQTNDSLTNATDAAVGKFSFAHPPEKLVMGGRFGTSATVRPPYFEAGNKVNISSITGDSLAKEINSDTYNIRTTARVFAAENASAYKYKINAKSNDNSPTEIHNRHRTLGDNFSKNVNDNPPLGEASYKIQTQFAEILNDDVNEAESSDKFFYDKAKQNTELNQGPQTNDEISD